MLPTNFHESNAVLKKPEGWTDEQCGDLQVFKGKDTDGRPMVISKWQPSKEDIDAINNGHAVYLAIIGNNMPPVFLFTQNPFG